MTVDDLARVQELIRPEFVLPDLAGPNIVAKRVAESPDLRKKRARLAIEIHVFLDPRLSRRRSALKAYLFPCAQDLRRERGDQVQR